MVWQSTSVVVARATVQGLFAKQAELLRTPEPDVADGHHVGDRDQYAVTVSR